MCADPITLLTVASTAISVGGSLMAGQQAAVMGEYQERALQQQAQADAQATAFEISRERRKQELAAANARAQVGASGVALSGSPTEVLAANAEQSELDLSAIRYGSQLRQGQMRTQGGIARWQGQQERIGSYFDAAGSIFKGASSIYGDRSIRLGSGNNPFTKRDNFPLAPYSGTLS